MRYWRLGPVVILFALMPLTAGAEKRKHIYSINLVVWKNEKDHGKSVDFLNELNLMFKKKHSDVEVELGNPDDSKNCPRSAESVLRDCVLLRHVDKSYPLAVVMAKDDGKHGSLWIETQKLGKTEKTSWTCHYGDEEECLGHAFKSSALRIREHHEKVHQVQQADGTRSDKTRR